MNTRLLHALWVTALAAAMPACKPPLHLSYDFGRAYVDTLRLQTDLSRESVVNEAYLLYGQEGVAIRLNAAALASDAETGEATLKPKVK